MERTILETRRMNEGAHWAREPVMKATAVKPIVVETNVLLRRGESHIWHRTTPLGNETINIHIA